MIKYRYSIVFKILHAINNDGCSSQELCHLVTDVPTRISLGYIPELQNTLNGLAEDPEIHVSVINTSSMTVTR